MSFCRMVDGLAGKDESRKVSNRSNAPLKEISFHSSHIPAFTEIESTHVTQQSIFDGSVMGNSPSLSTTTSSISRTSSLTQTAPTISSITPKVGITESTALDSNFRAVHEISLLALIHNYRIVEAAAANQKCSVIVVTKADGYGHGAVETVLHLANQGADAFAVATLEEAITLRKALCRSSSQKGASITTRVRHSSQNPGTQSSSKSQMASCESQTIEISSLVSKFHSPTGHNGDSNPASISNAAASRRAHHIRILVLGPPVGCPDCFDDYYYYSIECMITGPEVAASFLQWARNPLALKRRIVERTAKETKEQLQSTENHLTENRKDTNTIGSSHRTDNLNDNTINVPSKQLATLSGSSGKDLVKEYKQFLQYQQKAAALTPMSVSEKGKENSDVGASGGDTKPIEFCGIEAVALSSRNREKATASQVWVEDSVSDKETATVANSISTRHSALKSVDKRLKWHAVIDTGMGRVGFKPELPTSSTERRDTVEIIQEMIHAQFHQEAPIEFYGMCTHMADANSNSSFTHDQIGKFRHLLERVRNDAGIFVPTVSTDNSSALLTTTLTHFDPNILLLSQNGFPTRGYVRVGGAIYGQRPAFPQLKPVSTLLAAVRHVSVMKEGESVGYDRAYVAPQSVRIATLAIGFADGYPRDLGNGRGKVAIRSKLYPIAGNVCMDMLMVDLGPAEEETDVRVGDIAVLWGGEHGMPLKEVASILGTTQSDLTCGLKSRVLRKYVT